MKAYGSLLLVLGLVAGWVLSQILRSGTVGFALDDAYITLDLADQLWRTGVYGVNPGVVESPASSILWPFLLAPLSATPWPVAATLALTTFFTLASTVTLARLGQALAGFPLNSLKNLLFTLLHVVLLNLPGLALIGLEHALQVWLTLLAPLGVVRVLNNAEAPPPWWLWVALLLGPLVRYENLVVTMGALGILGWRGHLKGACLAALVVALLLGAFSLFLSRHGLDALPGSVLVKKGTHGLSFGVALAKRISFDMWMPFAAFLLVVAWATGALAILRLKDRRTVSWAVLASLAGAGLLHALFGLYSGFNAPRYEVYLIGWSLMLLYWLATQTPPRRRYGFAALLLLTPLLFQGAYFPVVDAPRMLRCLFEQQTQMRRFAVDFWRAPVAVNDIGLVGYRNPAAVLDLVGLADHEVRHLRQELGRQWRGLDALLIRRDVELVMVYAPWFPAGFLRDLHPLGTLTSRSCAQTISAGGDTVTFFARTQESEARLRPLLADWRTTLPDGAQFTQTPP